MPREADLAEGRGGGEWREGKDPDKCFFIFFNIFFFLVLIFRPLSSLYISEEICYTFFSDFKQSPCTEEAGREDGKLII